MAFDGEDLRGVALPRWYPDGDSGRNFGDELGPLVARLIVGGEPDGAESKAAKRLVSIGSVAHFAQPGDVLWGTGINGKVRQRIKYPLDVRAVRGPYTRAVLLGHGIAVPEIYGDPALLLPRLLPELVEGRIAGDEVIVPNLNDRDNHDGEAVLDPLSDALYAARRIAGAGFVIASSLHALILADAFGVGSRPVLSSAEHPFKYVDYYAGTGRRGVRFASTIEEARSLGPVEPARFDADALLGAFPLDLWDDAAEPHPAGPDRFAQLRQESASAFEALARGYERRETPQEAAALTRALQLTAEQDPTAVDLLRHLTGESTTAEASRALHAHLRTSEARRDLDARITQALRSFPADQDQLAEPARVIWDVAKTGKLSLARAVARGEAEHAAAVQYLQDHAPRSSTATPAEASLRLFGVALRRPGRGRR